MLIEPTDPKFKEIVSMKNIKSSFEHSLIFYELDRQNFRMAGTWVGERWVYDHPTVNEHFTSFSDGFISGVSDYYISSADEEHQQTKRMNAQMYETAGDDEIVLDITPYLK